ncbi:MAG: histidine--tRNA ligase [Planctomycetota bacterium]
MSQIEPRTLKGFRDYLPEQMIPREALVDTARRVYRSYGFLPIDTPALEYEEILTGKGGAETDKQLYRFVDHGGRQVALRFDLTVPLARFVAQHSAKLGLPFKRYHIATVWRGENTQRGRYREFMQCDFDTIGTESIVADIESVLVIHDVMRALGFERFTIRINDRRFLTGVLEGFDFSERHPDILRVLDKRDKIGVDAVVTELGTLGFDQGRMRALIRYLDDEARNPHIDPVHRPLSQVREAVLAAGVAPERIQFDTSIARGLDYYTGIVFETRLDDLPGIGSVCSGGRYDDLAQLYTKERLPGVGASLGLDRLLAAMEELKLLEKRSATAPVFLPYFDAGHLADYLRLAARLRAAGLGVELYPEPKKLGAQLKYADRRGFRFALVLGDDEWKSGNGQVKDLVQGSTRSVKIEDASGALHAELLAALR